MNRTAGNNFLLSILGSVRYAGISRPSKDLYLTGCIDDKYSVGNSGRGVYRYSILRLSL